MLFVWWFFKKKKKKRRWWRQNYISFPFPLCSLSSHYQKVCSSCIQQATVCVRMMYYLLIFLFLQCECKPVSRGAGGGGCGGNYGSFHQRRSLHPLILASKSELSYDWHPLCKNPLFHTSFFESLCTDLGYILSKSILI